MNNKIIEVQDITKIYNVNMRSQFTALSNVSLDVCAGDFLCIMGPSGSGKSTLLNNMSTIDEPTDGKVFIDGQNVLGMKESDIGIFRYQKLGFIFQDYNLVKSLTIFENIATPLTLQGIEKEEIKQRVEEVSKKLKIEAILNNFPNNCSGGEKQRVAIARAIITNPKIIIADEPTGNLDSKNSHELLSLLKEMNEKQGLAIVMVSHDAQIASYSSKLYYLKDGQIETKLVRGEKSQKDYFYEIVGITSGESQKLFD